MSNVREQTVARFGKRFGRKFRRYFWQRESSQYIGRRLINVCGIERNAKRIGNRVKYALVRRRLAEALILRGNDVPDELLKQRLEYPFPVAAWHKSKWLSSLTSNSTRARKRAG